jgi:hypothetical protein
LKTLDELSTMPILADCPASKALSAAFAGTTGSELTKTWVDFVMVDPDRSRCFGRTAVSRAMKKLNTKVHYFEGMLDEGELRIVDGRRIAFIPISGSNSPRELFTLAHELGHAALHELNPDLDQSGPGAERLCDRFAAELLMPARFVHVTWQETPNADAITTLKRRTSCSVPAACVRIAEYLGTATTGQASAEGTIIESYGAGLSSGFQDSLANACRKASAGGSFMISQNGLTISTRTIPGRQVVFLVHRVRKNEKNQRWQEAEQPRPPDAGARGHVFISYVGEDSERVSWLERQLEAADVQVWRDKRHLWPGEDWSAKIRQAIQNDALVFIACFSSQSLARVQSYQNEEIALAIEQLQRRNPKFPWLIPVRFDDCDIPDLEIGGRRTLRSLQRADLFGAHIDDQTSRLVRAVLRILGQPDPQT